MLSVQRWLEKNNRCFELLESSARQSRASVRALSAFLKASAEQRSTEIFDTCRADHKRLTQDLTHHLCVTFVTPIEREDIAKLVIALNRVTKAVGRYVQRFQLAPFRAAGWNLQAQAAMLEECGELMGQTVSELCHQADREKIVACSIRLQQIERNADHLLESALHEFYRADVDNGEAVTWVYRKDLAEHLERIFDRCRSVGNITYWTLLRNT